VEQFRAEGDDLTIRMVPGNEFWLPFVDTHRTFCLAPEAKELLLGVQQLTHLLAPGHSAGTNSTGSLGGERR
jgi:hypothetical protein